MNASDIATLLMSLSALGGTIIILLKARSERNKSRADTESVNADTIIRLSKNLQEAYSQIDKLRDDVDALSANREELSCHRDYEEYLLRGIVRLTASLAANELSVPWIPMSFIDFVKREDIKKNKEA